VQTLRPFVERVVDWFTPRRLLLGSDWPVCLLAGSYEATLKAVTAALPDLSPPESHQRFGGNAARVYGLDVLL
jgi:L-fuconolactonase